ncbi:Hypothetical protein CINCED_3A010394 [Cinara cedri]|nr:Hypothetical protein CINCED_3A010394 [Cinara cedri]
MDLSLLNKPEKDAPKVLDKPTVYADGGSETAAVPLDLSVKKNQSAAVPAEQPPHDSDVKGIDVCPDADDERPPASKARAFESEFADVPAQRVYCAPEVSPLIADHVSPADHSVAPTAPDASAASFRPYTNPMLFPAFADAQFPSVLPPLPPLLSSLPPLPSLLPPLSALTAPVPIAYPLLQDASAPSLQYHHHLQQQQHQLLQHQHQLQLQQEHQLQLQQQQHFHFQLQQQIQLQQQQLASYAGGAVTFQVGTPLLYASDSPSSSASDCNHFQYGGVHSGMPRAGCYIEHHPHCGDMVDERGMRAGDESFSSSGRSDCVTPDWTPEEVAERRRALEEEPVIEPDEMAEEIAAIYRQSDFIMFRQRYLESLGPPKNFEKMRRSVPGKRFGGGGPDHVYVMKRQKNNEAAKRSRDAKRQKYIENQISVIYLTKKVNEMKEIKRRLLMSM